MRFSLLAACGGFTSQIAADEFPFPMSIDAQLNVPELHQLHEFLSNLHFVEAASHAASICKNIGLTHFDFEQQCPSKMIAIVMQNMLPSSSMLDLATSAVNHLTSRCTTSCDLQILEAALTIEHKLQNSPLYPLGQRTPNKKLPRFTTEQILHTNPPPNTPYIISDAFPPHNNCSSVLQSLSTFSNTHPTSLAEYYDHGLEDFDSHLDKQTLLPISESLNMLVTAPSPAYVHWYMSESQWQSLITLFNKTSLLDLFPSEKTWADSCFPSSFPSSSSSSSLLRNEFFHNFRWWAVYAGNSGIGMFSHKDRHGSGSWQAQICGSKRWRLCNPNHRLGDEAMYSTQKVQLDGGARTANLGNSVQGDLFHVDYESRPLFRLAECYDDTTFDGEVVYYPADWWHQTITGGSPELDLSVTLSSLVADSNSAKNIKEALDWECEWAGKGILDGVPRVEVCEIVQTCIFPNWRNLNFL